MAETPTATTPLSGIKSSRKVTLASANVSLDDSATEHRPKSVNDGDECGVGGTHDQTAQTAAKSLTFAG